MFRKIRHSLARQLKKFQLPEAVTSKNKNVMGDEQDCSPGCGACCVRLSIDEEGLKKKKNVPCEFLTEQFECSKMLQLSQSELKKIKSPQRPFQSSLEFCGHWTCRKVSKEVKMALWEYVSNRNKVKKSGKMPL